MLLDRLLTAYSYVPHHPGKGRVFDRLLPHLEGTWKETRTRTRYRVRFECDLRDKVPREIFYTGFDRADCRVLRNLVKPGAIVLDAGANIGYFSLLCAQWMRKEGIVHAFEPFPLTIARFERNLDLNPSLRGMVRVHNFALSDFVGTIGMSVPDTGNSGCNYLNSKAAGAVNVMTLDSFVESEKLPRIDLIKIDVEGSELALLRGAQRSIERFRPVLMVEVNPFALNNLGNTATDLIRLIGGFGYVMYRATRTGRLRVFDRVPSLGEEPNVFAFPIR
jgi:FkbM family methyltransferase